MVVKWYPHYNEVRIRGSPCYQPPAQEKMSLDQTLRSYAWLYKNYQRMWFEVGGEVHSTVSTKKSIFYSFKLRLILVTTLNSFKVLIEDKIMV